jgi:hypothetical protein
VSFEQGLKGVVLFVGQFDQEGLGSAHDRLRWREGKG